MHISTQPTKQFPSYVPTATKAVYTHKKYALDLKDTSKWPAAHMLKFNESQLTAFKSALTSEVIYFYIDTSANGKIK